MIRVPFPERNTLSSRGKHKKRGKMHIKIKKDKFFKQRGSSTKIINLSCSRCNKLVLIYQKDGPGWLKRCYLNRIIWPKKYASLRKKLICKCGNTMGLPNRHVFRSDGVTPDGRWAYELAKKSFIRKINHKLTPD